MRYRMAAKEFFKLYIAALDRGDMDVMSRSYADYCSKAQVNGIRRRLLA